VSIQQPQESEWRDLEQYDTGMGANFENIRDHLLEKAEETAEKLDLSYNPSEEDYQIFYSEDESKALLYGKSWGSSPDIIAEVTAFECDRATDKRGGSSSPRGREIKIGNHSTVEINEGALRGAIEHNRKNY